MQQQIEITFLISDSQKIDGVQRAQLEIETANFGKELGRLGIKIQNHRVEIKGPQNPADQRPFLGC